MRKAYIAAVILALSACAPIYTEAPDNRIKVSTSPSGEVMAIPPDCLSWSEYESSPVDNQSWPQMGCSSARNLAVMVEEPKDLVQGSEAGTVDGVVAAKSIEAYRSGKTKALRAPTTTSTNFGGDN